MADQNAIHEEELLEESIHNGGDADDEEEEEVSQQSDDSPLPDEWNRRDKASMVVHDVHRSQWEYGTNMIRVNQVFRNKSALQEAVCLWALSSMREFWVKISSQEKYAVYCKKPGCQFRVYAHKPRYETHWEASVVVNHSCQLEGVLTKHRNLTAALIASVMFTEIIEKRDFECSYIMTAMRRQFKYNITYLKAWRAKRLAMEKRFGTFEASYCNLPRVLQVIKEKNPGTYTAFQESEPDANDVTTFERAFFSLGTCIESFRHCRPLLCVDGTFLTGKYKGQILTAIGVDANNQILPLAFAFVEGENRLSWLWFFRHMKYGVVGSRPNVCIIHDRHKGIRSAIKTLQQDQDDAFYWPDMQNRWCMRHMGANFYSYFKSKTLMNMFKRLCKQNQTRKFYTLWRELDANTRGHLEEEGKKPPKDDDTPPKRLPPLGELDPPGLRRRSSHHIKCFSHWIEAEPKEKWSLLYDTNGSRYV